MLKFIAAAFGIAGSIVLAWPAWRELSDRARRDHLNKLVAMKAIDEKMAAVLGNEILELVLGVDRFNKWLIVAGCAILATSFILLAVAEAYT